MRKDPKHCLKASTESPTTIKRKEDDNHTGNWRPVSLTQAPKTNCELVINIWRTDGPHQQIYFCKEPTKTNWSDLAFCHNMTYLLEKGSTYILYSWGGRWLNVCPGGRVSEPEAHLLAMLCVSSQKKTLSWESLWVFHHIQNHPKSMPWSHWSEMLLQRQQKGNISTYSFTHHLIWDPAGWSQVHNTAQPVQAHIPLCCAGS